MNFLDADDDTSRVREAYGADTYRRLTELKAKYDPQNVFHNNKNIQPATPARAATADSAPHCAGSSVSLVECRSQRPLGTRHSAECL